LTRGDNQVGSSLSDASIGKEKVMTPAGESPQAEASSSARPGALASISNQFGFRQLVTDYLIPVESNSIWYLLGGVLAIGLALEILTGILLSLVYIPDAGKAYGVTAHLLKTGGWSFVLNFHFFNSFLIFGLVMIHMLRVFITGGYRRGKEGLWLVGVGLAGLTFVISLTGEALHWDEVGFGVPWNISEVLSAVGLSGVFNYTSDALLAIPTATEKLVQIYVLHVSIVPIALGLFIAWHYLLIRFKGISVPFWLRASGRTSGFGEHIRGWLLWGGLIIGIVVLVAIFVPRDAGTSPQLLPSSPLYGTTDDPGGLGFKPTYPISWTRGMNIIAANLGIDPDIWGAMIGMALLLGTLLVIPFLDRGAHEPDSSASAFDMRKRGWAFLAMGIFWLVLIAGLVQNAIVAEG
jgi:quinol-cytochrome oxidoreductase complex cytochrome b subunit